LSQSLWPHKRIPEMCPNAFVKNYPTSTPCTVATVNAAAKHSLSQTCPWKNTSLKNHPGEQFLNCNWIDTVKCVTITMSAGLAAAAVINLNSEKVRIARNTRQVTSCLPVTGPVYVSMENLKPIEADLLNSHESKQYTSVVNYKMTEAEYWLNIYRRKGTNM